MRRGLLGLLAVTAVLVAACGGEEPDPAPDFSGAPDAYPTCEQWRARKVTAEEVVNGCSVLVGDDPVRFEQKGTAVEDCADGRTLYWNDEGWGFVGEPMKDHRPGGEQVAPEADRSACSADG
jgi:hypothetical protein